MLSLSRAPFHGSVKLLNPTLCSLVAALLLAGLPQAVLAAEPVVAASKRKYTIAPGTLEHALSVFAAAAGVPLSFEPDLVAGKMSTGLDGSYSIQEGFSHLLENSGLELAPREGGYTLRPLPQSHSTVKPLKPAMLAEVAVTSSGEEENAWAPVGGYVAKRSATATKTDTLISETPQSISVVTREQMEAQGARTLEEALVYTASVTSRNTGVDYGSRSLSVRGFRASIYRDGLKTFSGDDYTDWITQPWALERVEVLKGPASVMYGQSEPGGIVNQISKRPSANTTREAQLQIGSYDRYQVAMDVGGKANEEGSLLYRVIGIARDSETAMAHGRDDRIYLGPSLTIKASRDTSLTLQADISRDKSMPKNFADTNKADKGILPAGFFAGEPEVNRYNRDLASIGYLLQHDLHSDLIFRQNMRYAHSKLDYRQVYASDWIDANTLERSYYERRATTNVFTLDNNLEKTLAIGSVTHRFLLGLDYQDAVSKDNESMGTASDLSVLDPVYGSPIVITSGPLSTDDSTRQTGVYLQDQMRMGKWIANLGIRYDEAKTKAGNIVYDTTPPTLAEGNRQDSATTYNTGLMYVADNGVAPYASYSTSFVPSRNVIDRTVELRPTTGKQWELGVKIQPRQTETLLTASLFDLRKKNIPFEDPDDPAHILLAGEIRSRGLELEAKSQLNSQLSLLASYTYLDAEVIKTDKQAQIGQQVVGTANNTAALWLDYRFIGEIMHGWSMGGGLRYTDDIACRSNGRCFVPGYTLADAAVRYRKGQMGFAVNVNNVFDKETRVDGYYNDMRTVLTTLTFEW